MPAEDPERPFEVPQILNVHHGVFIVENLDLSALAADGVREFALDPDPPQAARRHRRLDLADRPRLRRTHMDHYDVIIIGTGAGGGTLAHRLAPSGKRILLLERGGYLPREPENWDSHEVFNNDRYLSGEEWIDKDGAAFTPHQQYFVGGNTKFYGAILFRLRERDFGEVAPLRRRSRPRGRSPTHDLEPYYAEAEALYLVHGERGEDPTEPPALRAVPLSRRLARAAHPAAPRRLRAHRAPPVPPARWASTSTRPIRRPAAACAATASTASRA